MSYSYEVERRNLFTEEGQVAFLRVRDAVKQLLKQAGAFRFSEAMNGIGGDSWLQIACIDRLVELGEIVELPRQCWQQYKVYTSPETHNY